MNLTAFGDSISSCHLEVDVAYEHCIAQTFEATSWPRIPEISN
jgi:hypothetical protein